MQICIAALNVVTTSNRACPKTWERQFVICFAVGKAFLGSKECPTDNIEPFVETIIWHHCKARLTIHNATVNSCLWRNWFALPVPRRLFHEESTNSEERPQKINFLLKCDHVSRKIAFGHRYNDFGEISMKIVGAWRHLWQHVSWLNVLRCQLDSRRITQLSVPAFVHCIFSLHFYPMESKFASLPWTTQVSYVTPERICVGLYEWDSRVQL